MTVLLMVRDMGGENTFGLPPSSDKFSMTLAAGVSQSITVPNSSESGHYLAVFSFDAGANVWVAYDGNTASSPSGAASSTNSERCPGSRRVSGAYQISLISPGSDRVNVVVVFYVCS